MATCHRAPVRLASTLAGLVVVSALALACTEDPNDGRALAVEPSADELGLASEGQLGRIHVVLQPQPDLLEPEPQLQISGRFVEYRGVSEDFARARTNLPVPAWEQLVPGQCVLSERLLPAADTPKNADARELTMIDAGDLRVELGRREFVAHLSLVPDLLPWLSGVEYGHVDDRLPRLAVEPDGTSPIHLSLDGSPDGELEGFSASLEVPPALILDSAKIAHGRLTVDWRPPGDTSDTVVLRLLAFAASEEGQSEPVGEEVTCLVKDTGRATFALGPLARAGLEVDLDRRDPLLLRVSASRFDEARILAGGFGPVEIQVELRAQKTLPL